MVLEAFVKALQNFANLELLLFMFGGIFIGLIFGLIPGISGMVALALILPFVFVMTPEQALILMTAVLAVQFMGGSISAILLNIPGVAASSAATLMDGFPMTQKGEAGRALGAALTSSAAGSVITVFAALAIIPLLLPMVMALRSADMVFIILLGVSCIGVLGTGSMVKGLISGGIGLLIAFIGYQQTTAVARFTFDSLYLYDGVALIPLALGLFALPEMIALAAEGGSLVKTKVEIRGAEDVRRGMRDVLSHKMLVLRSSIIGFIVGIIPGVGASTAAFISYAQAKLTSKTPEEFGHGCVEGVIAPESANDAKEAGSLITTLALGIPGSSPWALILGAFIMLGLEPGPEMLRKHLDLSLTLLFVILIASVVGAALTLPIARHLARITLVPGRLLVPVVLILVAVGSFAYLQLINDLFVLVIFSGVGLVMRKYNYNRPALFIGYILGMLFEKYLFISLKLAGPLFFVRPISLGLIITMFAIIFYGPVRDAIRRRKGVTRARVKSHGNSNLLIIIILIMLFIIGWSLFGMEYFESKLLPISIGGIVLVLTLIGLWNELRARGEREITAAVGEKDTGKRAIGGWGGYLINLAWIAGFVLGIYLLSFIIAIPLFMLSYMRWLGTSWRTAIIFTVLTPAIIYGAFEVVLRIELYRGLLFTWLG